MKIYLTPEARCYERRRENDRHFYRGCAFMAALVVLLHLAARALGL